MKVALAGNPNSGKSTLFNELTGLNQKTGNFPGVTVERHSGAMKNKGSEQKIELIDLPGAYSLFSKSIDEEVTCKVLTDSTDSDFPDLVVVVVDGTSLRRGLYLLTQIMDLGLPVLLAVNMVDLVQRRGIKIDLDCLSATLNIPVVPINARNSDGLGKLKSLISQSPLRSGVSVWSDTIATIADSGNRSFSDFLQQEKTNSRAQVKEAVERYRCIDLWLKQIFQSDRERLQIHPAEKLDRWLTHPVLGLLVFVFIQFLLFQSVFAFSEAPMALIDTSFSSLAEIIRNSLPPGMFSRLLCDGIIPGIAGVLIFIPQIALLFAFIAVMEDTGYMARVSFMMDKLLRGFGLNGRSVIPLMGGMACAVPSVMGARTISGYKERLITVLVVPFMSCSARLPVYTLLISMVIPDKEILGFNLRGFTLFALYMIGFLAALLAALLLKYIIKSKEKSYYIMELPVYRFPKWSHVALVIFDKVKVFIFDAGKVIIAISVVLWFLSSFAPGDAFVRAEAHVKTLVAEKKIMPHEQDAELSKLKLESSYAGMLGRAIEPAIAPLGFDWKIGIAIVTSFAAREVFVGTMSTLYAAADPENVQSIRERMMAAKHADSGRPVYTLRSGIGLMLFYAFALQCMSTLAVVRRETASLKWPLIQFLFMGALAWLSAFVVVSI
jgi:ferrous iron transport protein B